jgi:hypothetical protein
MASQVKNQMIIEAYGDLLESNWRVSQHRKQKISYEDKLEQAKIWSTRCKTTSERD